MIHKNKLDLKIEDFMISSVLNILSNKNTFFVRQNDAIHQKLVINTDTLPAEQLFQGLDVNRKVLSHHDTMIFRNFCPMILIFSQHF